MKKTIFKCALFMAIIMCMSTIISCGDDDEQTGGGGNGTNSSKHIVKMEYKYYNSYGEETWLFLYDSKGRIVDVDEGSDQIHYTYSDNTIKSFKSSSKYYGNHTYTLSNGLIIRDDYRVDAHNYGTTNYTYDKDGYLISISSEDGDGDQVNRDVHRVEWENGNITKIIHNDDHEHEHIFEYTNLPWPRNWFMDIDGLSVDEYLTPLGVWGKTPKNLPSKVVYNYYIDIYDYTIENGMITKMIHTWQSPYEFSTNTFYPIEWE